MPNVRITNPPDPTRNVGVIEPLFQRCIDDLFALAPGHPNQPTEIRVTYGPNGPHTRHGGSSVAGYDIDLTAPNDAWDQHVYQFSHEACHVLARVENTQVNNQWLEECLSEAGAIFCLKHMAQMGQTGPNAGLGANGKGLDEAFGDYANRCLADYATHDPGTPVQSWLPAAVSGLRADPNSGRSREVIGVIAIQLLPLYTADPKRLGSLQYLNSKPRGPGTDALTDKLQNWRDAAPPQYHEFIDKIRGQLM